MKWIRRSKGSYAAISPVIAVVWGAEREEPKKLDIVDSKFVFNTILP